MHTIKFNGWNTTRKIMHTAEQMGVDQLQIHPDGRGFFNAHPGHVDRSEFYGHIIPLQFAGSQDIDGKEIYCGDVVQIQDAHIQPKIGYIEFYRNCFVIVGRHENIKRYRTMLNYRPVKIIGNIYENPEFLPLVGEIE